MEVGHVITIGMIVYVTICKEEESYDVSMDQDPIPSALGSSGASLVMAGYAHSWPMELGEEEGLSKLKNVPS